MALGQLQKMSVSSASGFSVVAAVASKRSISASSMLCVLAMLHN
jgi:hypothetical protein